MNTSKFHNIWLKKLSGTHTCILFYGKEKNSNTHYSNLVQNNFPLHTKNNFSPFQIVIKMQRKHERFINFFKLGKGSKPFILLKISFDYFLFCGTRLFKQNNYVSQITKQLHITARGHINVAPTLTSHNSSLQKYLLL